MEKINKFNIFISILILLLGLMFIFSLQRVIGTFMTINQIQEGESFVSVNDKGMEEVYTWSFNRKTIQLDVDQRSNEINNDDE